MNSSITHAVLLAAGRGERLRPYTDSIPKPLLPHDGLPTLDLVLTALLACDIREVCLVTHYLAEQLNTYAEQRSASFNMNIVTARQSSLDGTAGAVSAVKATGWLDSSSEFLLSATDYLVGEHFYSDLLEHHQQQGCDMTASLKTLPPGEAQMRSSVRFVNNNQSQAHIEEIVEKPEAGQEPSAISANLVYVLPQAILDLVDDIPPSPRGEREIQTAINQFITMGGTACGLLQPTPTEWTPPRQA